MGLDQHRAQITADWLDTETGEVRRGRVVPADRVAVRRFLERFADQQLEVALEATTGWRFVVAELDLRAQVRLRHTLSEQRSEWQQRIQATLYHHGLPQRRQLMTADGRGWLAEQPLPVAAREQILVAVAMVDALEAQIAPLDRELRGYARRQAGCKALMAHYGIGELTAVTILAELGDCTRFSNSRQAVRYAGLDITVYQSDRHRAPGHISRQGPPALRWALYEAAQVARRGERSPDREYYLDAKERIGGNRACLSVARKLLKRSYHTLRELGEEALAPA
jgi:transposase